MKSLSKTHMNVFVEFVLLGVRFVFFPLSFSAEHISDFFKSNISQYSVVF